MRFSSEEVNSVHQKLQEISSQSAQIELMTRKDMDALVELFSIPEFHTGIDLKAAPDKARLEDLLYTRFKLLLWRVYAFDGTTRGKQVGYIGWNGNSGPPYVVHLATQEDFDLEIFKDATLMVVHAFFTLTQGDKLHLYIPLETQEILHDVITEAGFDFWQESPGVDPEVESTYIMERDTFHAYYIEEYDDDEEY